MRTEPFWTDGLPSPAVLGAAELPSQVDVAIVGGGYTGLSAALVLAKQGASVAVFERHTVGWGASSRSGGMATTGIKAPAQIIFRRYGKRLGRAFWHASLEAIDLIEQIVKDEGISCDFVRPGHVGLAYKPSHFEAMKDRVAWYHKELGYSLRLLGPSELSSEIGSKAFHGGFVDDYSGGLHPAKYVQGLGAAAARHGAHVLEQTEVARIQQSSEGIRLCTSRGDVTAAQALVATNGYTGSLVSGLRSRVFPVGSYIIVTEPLPPEIRQTLSPNGRMYYDSKNFLNYFRLTPDGRMLFGGRNNLSTGLDLRESARRLRRRMVEVFPELRDVAITHSWTGQLGLTFDLMPHIGRIDGIHYALGYCGHGVSIATYVGAEAGLVLSGQKTTSPFAEIPHPTRFFYRGRPWFLPLAALYYRAMDWIA